MVESIPDPHFPVDLGEGRLGLMLLLKPNPFLPEGWTVLKTEVIIVAINIVIVILVIYQEGGPLLIVSASGDQFESWESALHCLRALGRGQQILRAVRRLISEDGQNIVDDYHVGQVPVIDERPKSPIEKRKRNLKFISPVSREERETGNSFLQFREEIEKSKRIFSTFER